jgi:hypothetical protein
MKRALLIAVIGLLSTASILAVIRQRLGHRDDARTPEQKREAERKRIREALGDILAPPIDLNDWPEHLRPRPGLPDTDTIRKSMPRSERPAWHDLREDRDARG